MFLARKITRAKWNPQEDLSEGEIAADAVTADLRTQTNSLSFWQCQEDENGAIDIEDATLAIAAAGDRIDKIDIVWLTDDELRNDGQDLKDTTGRTCVAGLANRHVDVCRLDYARLGKIARCVLNSIEKQRYKRFTKKDVKKLLATAVKKDRIKLDDLSDKIRREIDVNPRKQRDLFLN